MNSLLLHRRVAPAVGALLVLAALALAFAAGRRSIRPVEKAADPPAVATGEPDGHGDEEGAEVIRFDQQAMDLAGIEAAPVAYRRLAGSLELPGTVEADQSGLVRVTPRAAGKIVSLSRGIGDAVRRGDVLARLASSDLARSQAEYRQSRDRLELARANLARQTKLAGLGEFGRHKVEEARQREIEAHGEINQAQTELARARNEVAEARSERAALEGEVARAENEVGSARSEIIEAQGQVRALDAALRQSEAAVSVAESKFNRYERLLKEELVSRQDWEQARADLAQARSNVDAARANIARGQAQVQTARAHQAAAESQVQAARARVQQAADKIETLIARQRQVEDRLATARKRDELAEEALAREERIYKGRFLTSKEILEAQAAVQLARAELRAAGDAIYLLGGKPGAGNLIPVEAPIEGRISERNVSLGETVDETRALFTILNLKSVWVQLAVHQRELPLIRLGQQVTITSETAPGQVFQGVVSYIGQVVDETTRTAKVRTVVMNRGGLLKPETFVRGKIAAGAGRQMLAVPRDAVQMLDGKQVVFIAGDHPGEFEPREVQTGETIGGMTRITGGLEPGMRVVTRGAFTVRAQAQKAELGHSH